MPITVLIVDDSALIRQMFSEMLSAEPDIEVIGTAADPYEAREKIKALNPDVLTLDIEMPKMDGLSFLEKIMSLRPMPVIMASTLTQKGASATIKALEIGAFDTVAKPVASQTRNTLSGLKQELVSKVRAAATANLSSHLSKNNAKNAQIVPFSPVGPLQRQLIAIGSSTGGVEALRDIFIRLPENCPPIVITQHMPPVFTTSFATRLNSISKVTVSEAAHHDRIHPGHAYLAPGGVHMKIVRVGKELVCKLEDGAPVSGHKPSVDILFHSVADAMGPKSVGVICTGMGKDGAVGLKAMRESGAYTIGQNQSSCIVYGMPQAAAKIGATQIELPLLDIPEHMLKACEKTERSL